MRKNIPLYREAQGMIKTSRAADANFGLWYDKFCFYWDGNKWTLGENKKDWIATVTGRNICGQVQQIKDAVVRYIDLIRAYGGQVRIRTVSRFVTGLGREHQKTVLPGTTLGHALSSRLFGYVCCATGLLTGRMYLTSGCKPLLPRG